MKSHRSCKYSFFQWTLQLQQLPSRVQERACLLFVSLDLHMFTIRSTSWIVILHGSQINQFWWRSIWLLVWGQHLCKRPAGQRSSGQFAFAVGLHRCGKALMDFYILLAEISKNLIFISVLCVLQNSVTTFYLFTGFQAPVRRDIRLTSLWQWQWSYRYQLNSEWHVYDSQVQLLLKEIKNLTMWLFSPEIYFYWSGTWREQVFRCHPGERSFLKFVMFWHIHQVSETYGIATIDIRGQTDFCWHCISSKVKINQGHWVRLEAGS